MVTHTPVWGPDKLGPDYEAATIDLGSDPDGEGEVVTTLVHYAPHPTDQESRETTPASHPALVWLHGMTDYFFQTHVAEHFAAQGYDFYAVDLRKCGRSRRSGQSWHYVSDLAFYYVDLNAALDAIPNEEVVFIAHSTGGLIAPLWMDQLRQTDQERYKRIKGLILNSPWLDMMGVPECVLTSLKPLLYALGRFAPKTPLPGGNLTAYGESVHQDFYGEWGFDLRFKPLAGHRKYVGWIAAVFHGFDAIHSGRVDAGVPILTLQSTRTQLGQPYSDSVNHADVIIDVAQTRRWAKELSIHYTLHPIKGARHDVFLSLPHPLQEAFSACDRWLSTVLEAPKSTQ